MIHKQIDEFYRKKFNKPIESKLNWTLVGDTRKHETQIHEILLDIYKNGIVKNVGVLQDLEGGLTIDYFDKSIKKDCRFIMGFTEIGYWAYYNGPIEDIKE